MGQVLSKAIGFCLIIAFGFIMKKRGIFNKEHGKFVSTLVMNVTLPCALIVSMTSIKLDFSLIICILVGILSNLIIAGYMYFTNNKEDKEHKAIKIINAPGYNIGSFVLPFVQSFFNPALMIYVILFDVGNAIMGLGGNFSIASSVLDGQKQLQIKTITTNLMKSIPFMTYLVLFILALFNIQLPKFVIGIASIAGSANGFLAMLVIGIILEIKMDFKEISLVKNILSVRYVLSGLFMVIIYFLLPISLDAKKMLMICMLAPIPSVAPIFSKKISDSSVPAIVNSLSMLVSIVVMTIFISFIS